MPCFHAGSLGLVLSQVSLCVCIKKQLNKNFIEYTIILPCKHDRITTFFGGGGLKSTWLPVITVFLSLILWLAKRKTQHISLECLWTAKFKFELNYTEKHSAFWIYLFPLDSNGWISVILETSLEANLSLCLWLRLCVLLIMLPFLADLLPRNLRLLSYFVLEFLQTPKPWQAREFISASEMGQHHKFCHIPGQWSQGWKGELN